jgi:hypothetical protein
MENANNEQKIIGTWVDVVFEKAKWVFNTNGTLTVSGHYDAKINRNYRFCVTDTKLALECDGAPRLSFCDISISSDGKNLLLEGTELGSTWKFWLTKK